MPTTWTLESLQFTPVKEKTRNVSFNGIVGAKCLSMTLKRQQAKQKSTFCKKLGGLAFEMAWELVNWVLYIWTSVTFSFSAQMLGRNLLAAGQLLKL